MKVLTAVEVREVDRLTTERYDIPSLQLMENAARRVVEAAQSEVGSLTGRSVLVLCGKGNNGGDGAAVARLAQAEGAAVVLVLLGRLKDTRGDAFDNLTRAKRIAEEATDSFQFIETADSASLPDAVRDRRFELIFDALLGTGVTRPASGAFSEAISFINQYSKSSIISVDIPSGLASDHDQPIGPAVKADLTVTFTAPKPANVLPPACDHSGKLVIASIGSPEELINDSPSQLYLIDPPMISSWLAGSRRAPHANKGDAGKVLVVGGSRGKTGAVCLTGAAALRAGAGLVTIATSESCRPVVAAQSILECMTEALQETPNGAVSEAALNQLRMLEEDRDVVALGPGLGSTEESTRLLVRQIVSSRKRPFVIDADGLNALAPWKEITGSGELPLILTPHPGEMSRLAGKPIKEILSSRVDTARSFATEHKVVLVLKGSRTLVAMPGGAVYISPTGNEGMASGGTGDVLTGIIAGLLAQKPDDPEGAAVAGVYLHGLAGDIAASRRGIRAMIATDIIDLLGDAFIEAGGNPERLSR